VSVIIFLAGTVFGFQLSANCVPFSLGNLGNFKVESQAATINA